MFRSVRPVATLGPFLTALISKGSLPEQEEEENWGEIGLPRFIYVHLENS